MKKSLLWLTVILFIFSTAIYGTKKKTTQQLNRDISFLVYKKIDYTSAIYNNTSAQLQITVEKVNGSNKTFLWSHTFNAILLKDYPSLDSAGTHTITVSDIQNSKEEYLQVTYICTYNSNGYTLQVKDASSINQNADSRLAIGI